MKGMSRIYGLVIAVFLIVLVVINVGLHRSENNFRKARNVLLNRIATQFQQEYQTGKDCDEILNQIYRSQVSQFYNKYDRELVPVEVTFIPVDQMENGTNTLNLTEMSEIVENSVPAKEDTAVDEQRVAVVLDDQGQMAGILIFQYRNDNRNSVILMNLVVIMSFLILMGFLVFVQVRILQPFTAFQEYPEKLAKNELTEKLPESKNRYFGKFIWGVNMLSDQINGDKKKINRLMEERQTMLTTIAHGIKTPVANVKLYASAVETGLYQPDGIANEQDADIARKIEKNADEINTLVKEMLETTSTGMVEFEPKIGTFYAKAIVNYIHEEFGNRFAIKKIPYVVNSSWDGMLESDQEGLFRILAQLLENAMKYGDGKQVTISLEHQEEGFFLSVRNHGPLLEEKELPYIFNSFWRGSNAGTQEGSGIGLFEAKTIAMRLGGDIYATRLEDSGEMEFVVYLPVGVVSNQRLC